MLNNKKMAIITFGLFDKKLYIIIALIIVQTIDLVTSEETYGYYNGIIYSMNEEIGSIIIGIITIYIFKPKKEKQREDKNNFKYLFILFLLRVVKSVHERLYWYVISDNGAILNTINGFEIFLMSLYTFILLKYKYYIHHWISMVLFCLLGILNDIILGNFSSLKYNYIYIYIIYILNDVLVFCYLKYMMDKLYFHYAELLLIWGIVGTIVKTLIFSGMIIYEYINDINEIVNDLYTYFTETNIFTIIFLQFFYFLLSGGIYYLLTLLELYYLRPNHMIITDEMNVYEDLFFYSENQNKYYSIIIFFIQMWALLFYYEILELNFWGLNNNTTKNIQKRMGKDNDPRESFVSIIELGDQYYIKNDQTKSSDGEINETFDDVTMSPENSLAEQRNLVCYNNDKNEACPSRAGSRRG